MDKNSVSLTSPSLHRDWFRVLHRQWKPALSHVEYAVAMMVFDRTLGWGKDWEGITYEHFIGGVWARDGKLIHPGTGFKRKAVAKALASLIKKGALRTQPSEVHTQMIEYSLNYEWIPDMKLTVPKRFRENQFPQSPQPVSLKPQTSFPKKLKEEEKEDGTKQTTSADAELAKPGEQKIETDFKNETAIPEQVDVVGDALLRLNSEHAQRHAARLEKNELGRAELMAIWQRAFTETFQQSLCVPLKVKDIGALRSYGKRWQGASVAGESSVTFGAFVDWSVRNWKVVLDTEMQWCKQPPALPAPLFLVRFGEHFERAFAARDAVARRSEMTTHQRIVVGLMEGGMTEAAAKEEADERTGAGKLRAKLEQEQAEVLRQRRVLEIERQQARTRMRFEQLPPPKRELEPVKPVEAFNFDDAPTEFPDYEA